MPKIYVTRPLPFDISSALKAKGFDVFTNPENRVLSKVELIAVLKEGNYDGVLCLLHDTIDKDVFDAAPTVKIFSNYAVGYNNIDIEEAKSRGVMITNTPSDAVNESVAEHTFALILALSTRLAEGDRFIREGSYKGWDPNLLIGFDLKDKILGLIGAGRIGSFVAQKASMGFGMKIAYYDIVRNEHIEKEYAAVRKDSVDELLRDSHVVTLHTLLSPETIKREP